MNPEHPHQSSFDGIRPISEDQLSFLTPGHIPYYQEMHLLFQDVTFSDEPLQTLYAFQWDIHTEKLWQDKISYPAELYSSDRELIPSMELPYPIAEMGKIRRIPIYAHIPGEPPLLYSLYDRIGGYNMPSATMHQFFPLDERPRKLAESWGPPAHIAFTHIEHYVPHDAFIQILQTVKNTTKPTDFVREGMAYIMQLFEGHCMKYPPSNALTTRLFTYEGTDEQVIEENMSFVRRFYTRFFDILTEKLHAYTTRITPDTLDRVIWKSVRKAVLDLGIGDNGAIGQSIEGFLPEHIEMIENQNGQLSVYINKDRKDAIRQTIKEKNIVTQAMQDLIGRVTPFRDRVFMKFPRPNSSHYVGGQGYCPLVPNWAKPKDAQHAYEVLTNYAIEAFKYGVQKIYENQSLW